MRREYVYYVVLLKRMGKILIKISGYIDMCKNIFESYVFMNVE